MQNKRLKSGFSVISCVNHYYQSTGSTKHAYDKWRNEPINWICNFLYHKNDRTRCATSMSHSMFRKIKANDKGWINSTHRNWFKTQVLKMLDLMFQSESDWIKVYELRLESGTCAFLNYPISSSNIIFILHITPVYTYILHVLSWIVMQCRVKCNK